MTSPSTTPIAPLVDLPVWVSVCKRGDAKMPGRGYGIHKPETWTDFATAWRRSGKHRGAGVNFKATPRCDAPELTWLVVIDLDKIFTPDLTLKPKKAAVEPVLDIAWRTCPIERSVSGRGAHVFAWINPRDLPLPSPGSPDRGSWYKHTYGDLMIAGARSGRFIWTTCDWLNPGVALQRLETADVRLILDTLEPRIDAAATATDWDSVYGVDAYADEANRYWDVVYGLPILAEGLTGYVNGNRNTTLHKAAYKARLHGIPRRVFLDGADVAAARDAGLRRDELAQVVDNGYRQASARVAA